MTIYTKIKAIDFAAAENIITNDDLTKILDTSDEWISTRTGIKERRVADAEQSSTTLGISAAEKVIKRCGINSEDIDLIIAACSAPEDIYPAVSCLIQSAVGAKNAACFDLRAACSGMIYSLNTARAFIKSGIYKNILIVATDTTTKYTDWNDRSTCVLFGDGAGAAIVSASDEGFDDIIDINMFADGNCGDFISMEIKGKECPLVKQAETKSEPYIHMKGKDVYKFVMQKIPKSLEELLQKSNTDISDIDYFIPHQSNMRMIDALAERINIEPNKVVANIDKYGNMSAASIPAAIREAVDTGKIKLPAKILICAFGAGMTWASAIIKLGENI